MAERTCEHCEPILDVLRRTTFDRYSDVPIKHMPLVTPYGSCSCSCHDIHRRWVKGAQS